MKNYIKHIFKKHLSAVLSIGFLIVFATTFHMLADAPVGGYDPGETLNPDCLPGADDCVVTTPYLTTDATTGAIALGYGAIAATNEFTLPVTITNWKFQGDSYALPTAFGAAGSVLTDAAGDGILSWAAAGGGTSVVQEIEVDLTAAQIKTAFTVPINTGISVGAGEVIEVISASMKYTFNTTPFDNALSFSLIIDGMINAQTVCTDVGLGGAVADYFLKCIDVAYDTSSSQLVDGADLSVQGSADSAAGDGTAEIYIAYRIITL